MSRIILILTFLVGCNAKLDHGSDAYIKCAKQCAPRAVGQLKNAWGAEVCGCDVGYLNKGSEK